MKQLVLVSLMLIAGRVLGQTTAAQSNPFLMKIDEMGRVLPNVGKDNVKGFPFLHEVTAKGWVKLKNGNRVSGFDLQVDLYNNALYFIFNGQYYQFAEPVAECQLAFPDNDDSLRYQFRTGYPVFRDRPATTLYQVLADGPRYQLLNYIRKNKVDIATYGTTINQEYKQTSEWYLYDVQAQQLQPVSKKTNPATVIRHPLLAAYVQQAGKPKTEQDWLILLNYINTHE